MWQRIFGRSRVVPSPAALVDVLVARGLTVTPHFVGDDLGWTRGELHLPTGSPLLLERYLSAEDDLRDDLNAYAAELETLTYSPESPRLMEWVIQSQQLITLRKPVDAPDEVAMNAMVEACCQFLAQAVDGIYQVDGRGWHDARGAIIIPEY
jgi:hypothetical protein